MFSGFFFFFFLAKMSQKLCCALHSASFQEAQDVSVSLMVRLIYYLAASFIQWKVVIFLFALDHRRQTPSSYVHQFYYSWSLTATVSPVVFANGNFSIPIIPVKFQYEYLNAQ